MPGFWNWLPGFRTQKQAVDVVSTAKVARQSAIDTAAAQGFIDTYNQERAANVSAEEQAVMERAIEDATAAGTDVNTAVDAALTAVRNPLRTAAKTRAMRAYRNAFNSSTKENRGQREANARNAAFRAYNATRKLAPSREAVDAAALNAPAGPAKWAALGKNEQDRNVQTKAAANATELAEAARLTARVQASQGKKINPQAVYDNVYAREFSKAVSRYQHLAKKDKEAKNLLARTGNISRPRRLSLGNTFGQFLGYRPQASAQAQIKAAGLTGLTKRGALPNAAVSDCETLVLDYKVKGVSRTRGFAAVAAGVTGDDVDNIGGRPITESAYIRSYTLNPRTKLFLRLYMLTIYYKYNDETFPNPEARDHIRALRNTCMQQLKVFGTVGSRALNEVGDKTNELAGNIQQKMFGYAFSIEEFKEVPVVLSRAALNLEQNLRCLIKSLSAIGKDMTIQDFERYEDDHIFPPPEDEVEKKRFHQLPVMTQLGLMITNDIFGDDFFTDEEFDFCTSRLDNLGISQSNNSIRNTPILQTYMDDMIQYILNKTEILRELIPLNEAIQASQDEIKDPFNDALFVAGYAGGTANADAEGAGNGKDVLSYLLTNMEVSTPTPRPTPIEANTEFMQLYTDSFIPSKAVSQENNGRLVNTFAEQLLYSIAEIFNLHALVGAIEAQATQENPTHRLALQERISEIPNDPPTLKGDLRATMNAIRPIALATLPLTNNVPNPLLKWFISSVRVMGGGTRRRRKGGRKGTQKRR